MEKKAVKNRYVSLRITDEEMQLINLLRDHYKDEGIKYNMSKAIRTFIVHCTKEFN